MTPEREAPTRLLVRGGQVVGDHGATSGDVLIDCGRIVALEEHIDAPRGTTVLDAEGCFVGPGLVDLHTHLREPGGERAETIETGTRAAALGGYSAVVAMPNTEPTIDSAAMVHDVCQRARSALVEVAVAGAITIGREGERLVPFAEMAAAGVRLFTDDGRGVQDAQLLRRALEYAGDLGLILAEHCEDEALARGGHMHEGAWSSRLGIPAQPALAEEVMLARDLSLVRLTRSSMHFLHLSTEGSVALLRAARSEGLPVTAEVTPHHLSLTDAEVASYDARFKVNPPLRGADDVAALREAVRAGLIDCVATDHAPHAPEAKEAPFEEAPPGMTGLETALSVVFSALVATKEIDISECFVLCSSRPARIAGLDRKSGQGGPVAVGSPAHLCVFDPDVSYVVDPATGASKSANSPFAGHTLTGRVRHTVVAGEAVVVDFEAQR